MAEAFARVIPSLVRLDLPEGVIDIAENIPAHDVQLVATTSSVLVRSDLHPEIVALLLRTMQEIHRGPGIFQRAGQFPMPTDPDFPVAAAAVDFYKNGPSRQLPITEFAHTRSLRSEAPRQYSLICRATPIVSPSPPAGRRAQQSRWVKPVMRWHFGVKWKAVA